MHKKLPHKTLRVHSARYTQCIHVNSCKLKLPKDNLTKKYKQPLPTNQFPKVELYIAVKCKNIFRVTYNDNRKKEKKTPHKTVHVHSIRHTQCLHVGPHKLKLPSLQTNITCDGEIFSRC